MEPSAAPRRSVQGSGEQPHGNRSGPHELAAICQGEDGVYERQQSGERAVAQSRAVARRGQQTVVSKATIRLIGSAMPRVVAWQ